MNLGELEGQSNIKVNAFDKKVIYIYKHLDVASHEGWLKVGETKTIDILNGTGSYSASGGTDYVTTKISNGRLNITGKAIGCTSVCVSSKATIAVIVVSSSTPDDLDSFIMEDWEGCDNVTSGTVYWTENDIQGHTWKWDFQ